jgi:hypothetical protein
MKNYLIGFCFLVGAFFLIWKQSEEQIERTKNLPTSSPLEVKDSNFSIGLPESNKSSITALSGLLNEGDELLVKNLEESETL